MPLLLVQVLRQNNSILLSLASSCVLREGQLIEVPGLGNGTSVCSDDSRMEDLPTTELLVLSPRQAGHPPLRSFPPVWLLSFLLKVKDRGLHVQQ
jgi:hypothetical protein